MEHNYLSYPDEQAYWQTCFASSLLDQTSWLEAARALRASIDLIESQLAVGWEALLGFGQRFPLEIKMHAVFLMLCGFAAENYLKARLVSLNAWNETSIGNSLPSSLKSHNLRSLANAVGVKLAPEELDLIDRLSEYAVWAGRYPSPVKRDDLKPRSIGETENVATYFRGSDLAVARCLLDNLENLVIHGFMSNLRRECRAFDGITIHEQVRPW